MEKQHEWRIGAHVLRFEPPDILWGEYRGEISLAEMALMVDVYGELGRARPFFLVGDIKDSALLSAEGRVYLSEYAESDWVLAFVYIGARLAHKAVARGILLAAQMTGHADEGDEQKVHFVATKAQARELLIQLRSRHSSKVA
ncbi:hypothetical protein JQX13_48210 [Archangium violaceum]|uniref:hypothetical protein n=1 Tax=Archangium violaceum TaxID=83451 RepID=UPI00193BEEEB|nr:hypothetical protein [Archangium violaceum]QRK07691.1 hypothetical protein JQX13_48210 [Archangium violaceum]